MVHCGKSPARTVGGIRGVALVLPMAAMILGGLPMRAGAALVSDNYTTGNGRHNRSDVSVNSPTFNRGIQHINNTNVSGSTNTQASFCKRRFRHCRIYQRLVVFDP